MNESARSARWPLLLGSATLLADAVLLAWVGVTPLRGALFALVLVAAAGSGALCLRARATVFPDRFSFLVIATAFGLALHLALFFVALHIDFDGWLGFARHRQAALLVLALMCALAWAGFAGLRKRFAGQPLFAHPGAASIVFALASFIGGVAHLGFGNDLGYLRHGRNESQDNTVVAAFLTQHRDPSWRTDAPHAPEWSGRVDSLWYVWLFPLTLELHGLPDAFLQQTEADSPRVGQFQHLGVSIQIFALVKTAGSFSAESARDFSKLLALTWFVLLGWSVFLIGRMVFAAPVGAALLASAGALLFAPLNLTWLVCAETTQSHVLTYVAGPLHWNLNQLAHLAIGLPGVLLVLLDLARPRRLYALGCVLVALSLIYRPPLYFVVVPALGLASLRLGRAFLRRDVLLGWAAILAALAFWFVYPRLIDARSLAAPVRFGFLSAQTEYVTSSNLLPRTWMHELHLRGIKFVILVLVYAALVLPALALVRELCAGGTRARNVLGALWRPEVLAVVLLFLWGTLVGIFVVEDDEHYLALNYVFGSAVAYTCLLPLLTTVIARMRNTRLRACAWLVYFAHLASGALNLWLYFKSGELM